MTVCVVNGCHNASGKNNKASDITFHLFPSDPIESARWMEKIRLNRNESYWKPSKSSKICSIHFDDQVKYTTKGGLCRLRRGAVPTMEVPIFSTLVNNEKLTDCHLPNQSQPGTSAGQCVDPESPIEDFRDLSPIFDTPKEALLRRKLKRKILQQKDNTKKIKTLKQKIRRLIKKNNYLQQLLVTLRKERYVENHISNDVENLLFPM